MTCELFYWRELQSRGGLRRARRRQVTAIEVKSGRVRDSQPGMAAFTAAFKPQRTLLVGGDGMSVEEFLLQPVEAWAKS